MPNSAPKVALVIVHWNQPRRCIRTLRRFFESDVSIDPLVVDNASEKTATDALRQAFPTLRVLELDRNSGFGPAANAGLSHWLANSEYEFIALAPHDALPANDCVARLISALRDRPAAGIACADLGDRATPKFDPYFGPIAAPSAVKNGWEEIDYPHGTLAVFRRSCLVDIGLFDEQFFAYGEELDLGIRARRAGWQVGIVRGADARNPTMRLGSTAVDYLQHRNTMMIVKRYSGRYHAFIRVCIAILGLLRGHLNSESRPPLFSTEGRLRAIVDFLRGRTGAPPERFFEELNADGDPAVRI